MQCVYFDKASIQVYHISRIVGTGLYAVSWNRDKVIRNKRVKLDTVAVRCDSLRANLCSIDLHSGDISLIREDTIIDEILYAGIF